MKTLLMMGASYGLVAGISPGPLLGMVINQTLLRGVLAGYLVALSPLFCEPIIVLLAYLIASQLPSFVFGLMSLGGGVFIGYLGLKTIFTREVIADSVQESSQLSRAQTWDVIRKSVTLQLGNPHPYLFWTTVAAPLMRQGFEQEGVHSVLAFVIAFYVLLVGAKCMIALLVSWSRHWMSGRAYRWMIQGTGVLMVILSSQSILYGIQVLFKE